MKIKILKNPQNEGPNPRSESKEPVAMVLVHDAVSSPKARGEAWPGLGVRPITSANSMGVSPIIILDVCDALILDAHHTYSKEKKNRRAKYYRGSSRSWGRKEHVPDPPIVEPLKRPRRNPILIPEQQTGQ